MKLPRAQTPVFWDDVNPGGTFGGCSLEVAELEAHLLGDAEIQVLARGEIPNAAPVKVWMSDICAGDVVSVPSTSILLGACPCIPQGCEPRGGGHQPLCVPITMSGSGFVFKLVSSVETQALGSG